MKLFKALASMFRSTSYKVKPDEIVAGTKKPTIILGEMIAEAIRIAPSKVKEFEFDKTTKDWKDYPPYERTRQLGDAGFYYRLHNTKINRYIFDNGKIRVCFSQRYVEVSGGYSSTFYEVEEIKIKGETIKEVAKDPIKKAFEQWFENEKKRKELEAKIEASKAEEKRQQRAIDAIEMIAGIETTREKEQRLVTTMSGKKVLRP